MAKVVTQARPESTDLAKLVTWASRRAIQPDADVRDAVAAVADVPAAGRRTRTHVGAAAVLRPSRD